MGILYNYIFNKDPGPLARLDKPSHQEDYYEWRLSGCEKLENMRRKVFTLKSPQGLNLKGYYYPASDTPSKTIAIIVHGYRSFHSDTAGMFADLYHKRGIDVFAIDHPAHGQSEGELITFGYFESEALLCWIQMLEMYFGDDTQFILHGFSMGGGTVCLASDRVPDSVKFIIDDCGINGAKGLLKPQLKIMYTPICILNLFKNKFKYTLRMTETKSHLEKARCPILFIHGKKDGLVPYEIGRDNWSNCSSYKEFLTVDDAIHMECYYLEPEKYEQKIDSFIDHFCV